MERVYEIGRILRNEGIDTTHNPEFTMLELYAAFWDVQDMMRFNEQLMAHLARTVSAAGDETVIVRRGRDLVRDPVPAARLPGRVPGAWPASSASSCSTPTACFALLREHGIPDSPTHAHALDKLFERIVEPTLLQPTFVYGYPVVLSPLAKRMPHDPELTERYELFARPHGAGQRLHRAQRPRRPAPPLRAADRRAGRRRRRDPAARLGLRHRARVRHAAHRRHRHRRRPARR